MNQRAAKIYQLKQELQALTRQYESAEVEEKLLLAELHNVLRRKLMTLRRVA